MPKNSNIMERTAEEFRNKFSKGELPYVDSDSKDAEFFLARARHYYGLYASNSTGIGFGGIWLNGPSRRSFKDLEIKAGVCRM